MSVPESGDTAPKSAAPAHPAFHPRLRVLIVDDLAENRMMLGVCCDQFGLAHEGVENGREAVEAAQSGRFDVILMDIFMPRMDGMTASRTIRALPGPVSTIPIIAVTQAAAPGEVLRYLDSGMNDVVPKPIDPSRLAAAISAALAKDEYESQPEQRRASGSQRPRRQSGPRAATRRRS
jgi:CheY-like chemotaxis protein